MARVEAEAIDRGIAYLDKVSRTAGKRHNGHEAARPLPQQAMTVPDGDGVVALLDLSEDNLAIAFAAARSGHLLYDHSRGKWLTWDGARWKVEETRLAFDWVRKFCRNMNVQGAQKWAKASTFSAVEMIARSDRKFARTIEQFDTDPWLLATPGGVVDLRTGALNPASPDLLITKSTAVAPAAPGVLPRQWLAFLDQATQGDRDLIRFLQQVFGYSLTGLTVEQMLLFIYGPGGNGKGVLVNSILRILGDYAQAADMQVFTASRNDRHPTELAALRGARLVAASETERDRPWAESRLKQLTGGDRIRARFIHQDEFEFEAQFQLVIVGNHKPRLRAVDDAMRRRLNIVNFMHKPSVKNPNLEAELRVEWPEILRWMIDGCLDWQRNGLLRPQVVIDATAEYFGEQDLLQAWLDECCEQGTRYEDAAASLFSSWTAFAKRTGEEPGTQTAFGSELGRAGFSQRRATGGRRLWTGLRLIPEAAKSDPRNPGEWDQ